MHDAPVNQPMMCTPSDSAAALAVSNARRMFSRALAAWAGDALRLRRVERMHPVARSGAAAAAATRRRAAFIATARRAA